MDFGSLPEILTAIGGMLVTVGVGLRWAFTRMDAREDKQDEREGIERAKLETMFTEQIASLRHMVETQGTEITRLRNENARYLRHVGILEGIMRAKGMDIPPMEGIVDGL